MKIISWNLNHRTNEKKIPEEIGNVIQKIHPDVLILNEYVDGDSRGWFKEFLSGLGYQLAISSPETGFGLKKQNQIFLGSKVPFKIGDLRAPEISHHSITNFLHVRLENDLELIGVRAPAFKKSSQSKAYWEEVRALLNEKRSSRTILIGDLNCDPFNRSCPGSKILKEMADEGWHIPNPTGEFSFISHDGNRRSRLDFAMLSPGVGKLAKASYLCELEGHVLCGSGGSNPLSDHAILSLNFQSEP